MEQIRLQLRELAYEHRAEADLKRALLASESSPDYSARERELREGIDRAEEMCAIFMGLYKTAREHPSRFRALRDLLLKTRLANVLARVRVDGGDGKTRETAAGESEKESCAICLQEFKTGFASMMNCSHYFHHECILTWLVQTHSCPICLYQLPNPNYCTPSWMDECCTVN